MFRGLDSYAPTKPIKRRMTRIEHMGARNGGTSLYMRLDRKTRAACDIWTNAPLSAIAETKGGRHGSHGSHGTSLFNYIITTDNEFIVCPIVNDAEIGSCHFFLTRNDHTRVYAAGQFVLEHAAKRITWNVRSGSYTRFLFEQHPKSKDKTFEATGNLFKRLAKSAGLHSTGTSATVSMHAPRVSLEYLANDLADDFKSTLKWKSGKSGSASQRVRSVFKYDDKHKRFKLRSAFVKHVAAAPASTRDDRLGNNKSKRHHHRHRHHRHRH